LTFSSESPVLILPENSTFVWYYFRGWLPKQYNGDQERIAELERVLGRKTLELEITKKASSILEQLRRKGE